MVATLVGAGVVGLLLVETAHHAAAFGAAFLVSLVLVPMVRHLVTRRGVFGLPGGRALHQHATPLLGGVGIFVPVLVAAVVLACRGESKMVGVAAGAVLVFMCGVCDDVRRVGPRVKIAAQVLAACCLFAAGFRLPVLSVVGVGAFEVGAFELPLIVAWVVLASNAFNLSDGLDGLAGLLALVGCVAAVAAGAHPLLAAVLAGATLGFLRHNLPRASIFLGDSGSLVVGFALAALALDVPHAADNVLVAYGFLAYSLGDVALAMTRRFLRGKPLFAGDRSHVHHKLAERLGSPAAALPAAVAIAVGHWALSRTVPGVIALPVAGLLWVLLAAALLAAGRMPVGRLVATRRPFRGVFLARAYVSGRLRMAETVHEVEVALRRLVEDLGLVSLTLRDLRLDGAGAAPPRPDAAVDVVVPLHGGEARFAYVSGVQERVVDDEVCAVVCDLLREADARLGVLRSRGLVPARTGPQAASKVAR